MSLVKLLPAWFHTVADYAVGILLIVVALAVDGSAGATATGVVVGAVVLAGEHAHALPARDHEGAAVHRSTRPVTTSPPRCSSSRRSR